MQHLTIQKIGPIEYCELDISRFMVLTGPQASGKSTVAKCVFFFKNMKSLIYEQLQKWWLLREVASDGTVVRIPLKNRLFREIRSNFLQIFGTTWCMDASMFLSCDYAEGVSIQISLKEATDAPNYIWVTFSEKITDLIASFEAKSAEVGMANPFGDITRIRGQIDSLFDDPEEVVYVPAGRSMITLLSSQINYIYSSMDDFQRKNLDYCTQNYLERILQLKPAFHQSADQQIDDALRLTDRKVDRGFLKDVSSLMKRILLGEYRDIDGDERLQVLPNRYVKINFASSGQQEVLWILNVLFHQLLHGKKSCFIIEEPESHLFPNAQKLVAEFIALSGKHGENSVILTTHSPYILGTLNNLLFASRIAGRVDKMRLNQLIPENRRLEFGLFSAFYLDGGRLKECVDAEFGSIENEVIDGASSEINGDYERMLALMEEGRQVKT